MRYNYLKEFIEDILRGEPYEVRDFLVMEQFTEAFLSDPHLKPDHVRIMYRGLILEFKANIHGLKVTFAIFYDAKVFEVDVKDPVTEEYIPLFEISQRDEMYEALDERVQIMVADLY